MGKEDLYFFHDDELINGIPNHLVLLLIRVETTYFIIRRMLVDQENSCKIMYTQRYIWLEIEKIVQPYYNKNIKAFDSSDTKPWRYIGSTSNIWSKRTKTYY